MDKMYIEDEYDMKDIVSALLNNGYTVKVKMTEKTNINIDPENTEETTKDYEISYFWE